MLQEASVLKRLNKHTAQIMVIRQSACGHDCSNCQGGCSPRHNLVVNAQNDIGASEGDFVEIQSSSRKVLLAAILVYLPPVFLLILFYLIADGISSTHWIPGVAGAFGFLTGIMLGIVFDRRNRRKNTISFEIIRILH